jgi:hypothetical protein
MATCLKSAAVREGGRPPVVDPTVASPAATTVRCPAELQCRSVGNDNVFGAKGIRLLPPPDTLAAAQSLTLDVPVLRCAAGSYSVNVCM